MYLAYDRQVWSGVYTRVFPKIDHSGNIATIVLGLKFVNIWWKCG